MGAAAEITGAEPAQNELDDGFEWAIVEIMGHRKCAGRVREEERFGAKMLRIDVPRLEAAPIAEEGKPIPFHVAGWVSQFYGGPSIFSYTPSDEATVLKINQPYVSPYRYSLPAPDEDGADDEEML